MVNSFNLFFYHVTHEGKLCLIGTNGDSFKDKTVCRIAIKNSSYIKWQKKIGSYDLIHSNMRCYT